MTITIDATYEGGVLVPAQPLPLHEHERVRVTVEPQDERRTDIPTGSTAGEPRQPSLAERIVARAHALPPEVLDSLPVDGASQHDHYIYGTPKRPE
ncbi:MAG: antitoxin family protein [Pirellulaceae bacterium]